MKAVIRTKLAIKDRLAASNSSVDLVSESKLGSRTCFVKHARSFWWKVVTLKTSMRSKSDAES